MIGPQSKIVPFLEEFSQRINEHYTFQVILDFLRFAIMYTNYSLCTVDSNKSFNKITKTTVSIYAVFKEEWWNTFIAVLSLV